MQRFLKFLGWSVLVIAAIFALALVWGPARLVSERLTALFTDETAGLIFVESPEVYTRQRLVNDRYRQDAWLKSRLTAIDDPDNVFIDTREALDTYLDLSVARGGSDAATAERMVQGELGPSDIPVPFKAEFELQSAARDKIRQLILENALDDRHDLSGNTVFGLKFDTAVLPGSNTLLSPTVVVRIQDDTVQDLPAAADLSPAYLRVHTASALEFIAGQQDAVRKLDRHFNNWRRNVELRLNDLRTAAKADLCFKAREAEAGTRQGRFAYDYGGYGQPLRTDAYRTADLDLPLCAETPDDGLRAGVEAEIEAAFFGGAPIKSALDFVMRLSDETNTYGRRFVDKLKSDAAGYCTTPAEDRLPYDADRTTEETDRLIREIEAAKRAATIRSWLRDTETPRVDYPLPDPWGRLFDLSLSVRPSRDSDACGAEIDFKLLESQIELLYADEQLSQAQLSAATQTGWLPLFCPVPARCTEGSGVLMARFKDAQSADLENAVSNALRPQATGVLLDVLAEAVDLRATLLRGAETGTVSRTRPRRPEVCFLRFSAGDDWFFLGEVDDENRSFVDAASESECFAGVSDLFSLGSYLFLSQIKNVESYTYAAFPRGDVQGVVTETTTNQRVRVDAGPLGRIGAALGVDRTASTRNVAAQPSIINFAAGEGTSDEIGDAAEVFDFGWSIVKNGTKEPMIASQLVLVSVPAYLDEVTLDLWKGFLDIDAAPFDRCAPVPGASGISDECDTIGSFNALKLEERLERLMPTLERREVTFNVPPDYTALDGVLIGADLFTGPRINAFDTADCVAVDPRGFTIAIPGERLWRSTVVTLDGQRATEIEVMPDMRGIIARFGYRLSETGFENVDKVPMRATRTLTVWTSEGNDSEPITVANTLKEATCPAVEGRR